MDNNKKIKLLAQATESRKRFERLERAVECLVHCALATGESERSHWALEAEKCFPVETGK